MDKFQKGGDEMAKIPLNAARVAAGLTQEELGEKMGVSRQTIINWETGKQEMKTVYLYAFCHVTGFSEDDILLPKMST
jgi:DNA-binding XRE family transcriptional regulator